MLSCPPTEAQSNPQLETILASYLQAEEAGQVQDRQAWLDRYPDFADDLRAFFESRDVVPRLWPERPLIQTPCRFGDYELLEEIAHGGMGVVYKARQLRPQPHRGPQDGSSRASSPAADVHGSTPKPKPPPTSTIRTSCPSTKSASTQGQHYFTMKLIDGGSLAEAGPGSEESGVGKQQHRQSARLLATVARAVHYAHQRGILHRDLKPSNILLDSDRAALCHRFRPGQARSKAMIP